jgi:restriction system protein
MTSATIPELQAIPEVTLLRQYLEADSTPSQLPLSSDTTDWRRDVGWIDPPTLRDFDSPLVLIKSLLHFGDRTNEGQLVQAVAVPWFEIMEIIRRDPSAVYELSPRKWEEIIAGAYERAGFDEVILTPSSGDKGRDVVATKRGVGSIRIFDQVKAYSPGHVVTAEEVRAMLGVITGAQNVSKGVITTTSTFAPRVAEDEYIRPYLPYRLELKGRDQLLPWLDELSGGKP